MRLSSLRYRYIRHRLEQLRFQRCYPDAPWLTSAAVFALSEYLRPTDFGFEWGSGRSTLWFAQRVGRLISVEASGEWHSKVKQWLGATKLQAEVDYRHIACEFAETAEPASHPYANAINELPDQSLDFALVDGHIRLTCMRAVLPKLKPGGLLILDNANRYVPNPTWTGHFMTVHEPRREPKSAGWAAVLNELKQWRSLPTTDGIWDTRFWIKPTA
jgi:hypothetical protein